jgi:hypothetical protein
MSIIEYRDLTDKNRSIRTVLAEGMGAFGRQCKLIHKTEGYEPAGSCCRHTKEAWGAISTNFDGTTYGQWYKTEPEARAHFERVTTPIVEQRA